MMKIRRMKAFVVACVSLTVAMVMFLLNPRMDDVKIFCWMEESEGAVLLSRHLSGGCFRGGECAKRLYFWIGDI
jgi:hypothetical protein